MPDGAAARGRAGRLRCGGVSGGGGKIKGAALREVLRWYERERGRAALRAIHDGLPPELATELDPDAEALGMLPSGWYPSALGHRLMAGVFGTLPEGAREESMRAAAHAALRATARGVYRVVLARVVSPGFLASNIQRLWSLLHSDGERFMVVRGNEIESRTRSWSGHDRLLCRFMMENTAAMLETMGHREVSLDVRSCVADGAEECAVVYRWRA